MNDLLDDDGVDEFTELVDADFGRIDLVGKGANGMPFLIAKSDGSTGLMPPDLVRSLIGGTTGGRPAVKERDDVTISGSPAAVLKMIHEAALRASAPNGQETPMTDTTTPAEPVAKADGPDLEVGDVVATASGGSTADSVPGSPAWEALDAETATNVIGVLARVKAALEWLSNREATEAVNGGDVGDAIDSDALGCGAAQVDDLIRQLAGFAATETLESDTDTEVDDVTKAALPGVLGALNVETLGALGVLEGFAPVVKAGRVLSTANEAAIRSAADSLQKVLSTLPAAPVVDDAPVTKTIEEAAVADTVEKTDATPEVVVPALVVDDVAKAKGDPLMAVYDEAGKLVGTIDPKDLSPIAKPQAPDDGGSKPEEAAPAAAGDLAPVPAAEQGTPATAAPAPAAPAPAPAAPDDDSVAKGDGDTTNVLKGIVDAAVAAAQKDLLAQVDVLKARLEHLEAPAPARVLTNGQLPPAHQMRGQDRGGVQTDVAKADGLRARLNSATSVAEREAIQKEMNADASAAFEALRADAQARRVR